jgi:hypothetical protein
MIAIDPLLLVVMCEGNSGSCDAVGTRRMPSCHLGIDRLMLRKICHPA